MFATSRHLLVGCALLASCAGAAHADLIQFRLDNHPRGEVIPPYYGMRLDNLFADDQVVTFSFSGNGASVLLDVDTDANTMRIYGTVYGGVDTGGAYASPELFDLDMTYTLINNDNGGWDVAHTADNGTLTRQSDNMDWTLTTLTNAAGHVFEFYPDRHRLQGGDLPGITWVGRGWLDVEERPSSASTRDFLFVATIVPVPAGVWIGLAGLGGVGLVRRLSRRR